MISMLPLADMDGLIGFLVFVVIMIISAITQVAGNKKEAPPRPQPRPRPPVRPAQAGGGRPAPGGRQGPVAQELEDFLRRAGGGRQPAGQQAPPVRQQQPPQARPVARPVVAQPVAAEVVDDLEVIESVAEHVSHSVGESRLPSQVAAESGAPVRSKFDHQMGQLDSRTTREAHAAALSEPDPDQEGFAESVPSTGAAGLAAMLGSQTSLRQAILISEILNRPEHRWK